MEIMMILTDYVLDWRRYFNLVGGSNNVGGRFFKLLGLIIIGD
jgi:hypothetical protein